MEKNATNGSRPDHRRRVLDVAAEVFAERGFAGARVDEIAERAGINKAMVYYHVGDKEFLYNSILNETIERVIRDLEIALAGAETAEDRFRAAIRTFAASAWSHPFFAPLMLREIASGGAGLSEEVVKKIASVFRVVANILEEGRKSEAFRETDPLVVHMLIAGGLSVLAAGAPIRGRVRKVLRSKSGATIPQDSAEIADYVAALFLTGLENREKPKAARRRNAATAARHR